MATRFLRLAALLLLVSAGALAQRAEILWDDYGVPHIYAEDTEALGHAFGWAQMDAHANALLRLYGLGSGRAAEHWGEAFLDTDRMHHTLGVDPMARARLDAKDPYLRRYVEAFAEGINAYAAAHPDRIADSLHVLLPISALDVTRRGIGFQLLFSTALRWGGIERWRARPGSNAWAVTGPKSASGNAMLLLNPHLPFTDEYRFVEAHLAGPDLDIYGATLLGIPVIGLGFTEHHGWTHTVNTQDFEDLYELTLVDGGYLLDGEVRAFEADTLTLRVLQPDGTVRTEPLVTLRSVHGPLVATRGDRALARRAVMSEDEWAQWWDMGRATSLGEFEAALRRQQMVGFTVTYADREGNILHYYGDAAPVRPVPEGAFWQGVLPGDVSTTLWHELHPYEDMPRMVNPPSGWVQNANEASFWATWPLAIDLDAFPDYLGPRNLPLRPQRSMLLLDAAEPLTFEDFVELRRDSRVELADRVLPDLIAAARERGSVVATRAADVLEAWDRTARADSRGGVLFQAWAFAFWQRPIFARPWSVEDPLGTPFGLADPAAAVAVLETVAQQVEALAGALDVPWGAVHRLRLHGEDVPATGGSGGLGVFRVFTFQPDADGRFVAVHGDTFVMAVAFGETPRAEALLVYGNATQAGSPHRTDQLEMAGRGDLRPVRFTRDEVEAATRRREVVLE
jgi:acyl-homoserine-lactone acylase